MTKKIKNPATSLLQALKVIQDCDFTAGLNNLLPNTHNLKVIRQEKALKTLLEELQLFIKVMPKEESIEFKSDFVDKMDRWDHLIQTVKNELGEG